MTTEELHLTVRTAIDALPSITLTAYRVGVAPETVRSLTKRLPKQVVILNDVLRQCGMELTIRRIE